MNLGPSPAERAAWDEQERVRFEEPDQPRDRFEREDFEQRYYDFDPFAGSPSSARDAGVLGPPEGAGDLTVRRHDAHGPVSPCGPRRADGGLGVERTRPHGNARAADLTSAGPGGDRPIARDAGLSRPDYSDRRPR